MASVLHGSARTTSRIRAGLKAAKAPARLLVGQYGLNVKTVLKWRGQVETTDAHMVPKPKSTVLTPAEEAIIVEFRHRTLLPLDDVLGCLKGTIPNLSRSALHRGLQRHGISRLPASEATEKRKLFKTYDIRYVHIDSCELTHADANSSCSWPSTASRSSPTSSSTSTPAKWRVQPSSGTSSRPFHIRYTRSLTDNGMAFADLPKNREGPTRRFLGPHIFDRVCLEHGIEHRLTKPYHPWTNGQELPPIKPDVTRVRLFGGRCACCGARAVALAPGGLEPGSPFASRSPHWWCTCITPTPSGWNGRLAALMGECSR